MYTPDAYVSQGPSPQEIMLKFDLYVRIHGYRPPRREDLVAGATFIMVDVEKYMQPHNRMHFAYAFAGVTRIKLDDEPVKPSNDGSGKEVVFYHYVMPPSEQDCWVGLEDFCASGYRGGLYENDTRYLIRRPNKRQLLEIGGEAAIEDVLYAFTGDGLRSFALKEMPRVCKELNITKIGELIQFTTSEIAGPQARYAGNKTIAWLEATLKEFGLHLR